MSDMGRAYALGARAWADGPARLYAHLAEVLVGFSPVLLAGRSVLDLGSGTGAGSRAALAAGARVIATDFAAEMLAIDRAHRPPAAVGDATALPFRANAFDVVLAPFCLNHLDDPARGVAEAGRVADLLLASTYATDDDHPAKLAVETALAEAGWQRPDWYVAVKSAMAAWGTVETASAAVVRGGLRPIQVEHRAVTFGELGPHDMVAWRIGLAPSASFVATLSPSDRHHLESRALALLGPHPPPIVRRVILIAAAR